MWPWSRGTKTPLELSLPRTAIVPRVRAVADVDRMREALQRESDVIVVEPFVGELVVMYAFDRPEHFQMVALRDLARLGLAQSDVRAVAVENLSRMCEGRLSVKTLDGLIMIEAPPDLCASTMLLRQLWDQLRDEAGTDIVAAAPNQDVVLACPIDDTDTVALIASMAAMDPAEDDPPELTRDLFVWSGAWEPLEEPDA